MSLISVLGDPTSHGPSVSNQNQDQDFIKINNILINVKGAVVPSHYPSPDTHPETTVETLAQNFITIENKPIALIGDSTSCGTSISNSQQDFISIN